MCGICGVHDPGGVARDTLRAMTDAMERRGPDGEGQLVIDPATGRPAEAGTLGLGNRRLAIIDPSPAGAQPMGDAAGDLWITYNGEVYNHVELRRELEGLGAAFRSGTDTEVILEAYRRWGERCVERFVGMWAFALWDGPSRRLFCSRDRFGIKPFLYWWDGRRLVFGSEIAVLLAAGVPGRANPGAVRRFLTHELVDAGEETFFAGVRHLPPAHSLVLDLAGGRPVLSTHRYWALDLGRRVPVRDSEAVEAVRDALRESVRVHLRSDVPVGTCLSGGLDSSAVVGAMTEELGRGAVRTFSAVFPGFALDESRYVDAVVNRAGARASVVGPQGDELAADLDDLVRVQGEPFGSPSIYAQWRVMRLAREAGVPVLLDGQGGDELFAGYPESLPHYALDALLGGRAREVAAATGAMLRGGLRRAAYLLVGQCLSERWKGVLSACAGRRRFPWVARSLESEHPAPVRPPVDGGSHLRRSLLDMLTRTHLPGFLRYEDRNSMAFSIEARVPFLDHRLVELAFALPDEETLGGGRSKRVLRAAVAPLVPESVAARRDKVGFATPEIRWLSENLGDRLAALERDPGPWLDHAGVADLRARSARGSLPAARALWRALSVERWREVMRVVA